jgi:hypothetical protein
MITEYCGKDQSKRLAHRIASKITEKCFDHCVSSDDCNPASHGNITVVETCYRCGAIRQENVNGNHSEISEWEIVEPSNGFSRDRILLSEWEIVEPSKGTG